MSAMVYWLLVPVRLSGNPSQQRRTESSRVSSTSIPTLNQTRPAENSCPSRFPAGVALRTHPLCRRRSNCVPPAGRGSVALSADPNQFQTRHKLRRGLSFLVSTVLAHGRHNGTRFLRPGGTQLLRRLDKKNPLRWSVSRWAVRARSSSPHASRSAKFD